MNQTQSNTYPKNPILLPIKIMKSIKILEKICQSVKKISKSLQKANGKTLKQLLLKKNKKTIILHLINLLENFNRFYKI